jgi:4'-phosphopantetheinyl transferase EntD
MFTSFETRAPDRASASRCNGGNDPAHALRRLFPDAVSISVVDPAYVDAMLFPEEAAQIAGAAPKRRAEFAGGRAAARQALETLGAPPQSLPRGFSRAPNWPFGFVGSISHSGSVCCAVAARADEIEAVGVDVETAEPLPTGVAALVCRADEAESFAGLPRLVGSAWANLAFSAKEAAFKAYHPHAGAFLEFHDLSLTFRPHGLDRGTFATQLRNPDRPDAERVAGLEGRWEVCGGLVLTSAFLPARRAA